MLLGLAHGALFFWVWHQRVLLVVGEVRRPRLSSARPPTASIDRIAKLIGLRQELVAGKPVPSRQLGASPRYNGGDR